MTSMKDRQEGYERKFAMDEEMRFKATARRNKMLGLWAAEKLGKSGPEADEYAKSVVRADFEEAGDEDVFRKVQADLTAGGKSVGDTEIRSTMDRLLGEAVEHFRGN